MPFTYSYDSKRPPASAGIRRWLGLARRRLSWIALAAASIALVTWLTVGQYLARADGVLLEFAMRGARPAAASNIVMVVIDEKSIQAIGRWPWRRSLHAQLLRQLSQGSPKCIGVDLLLDDFNANHPGDDAVLAQSMKEAGCVVLPMAMQSVPGDAQRQQEVLPSAPLARAATALGHSHLSVDDNGHVAGVYMNEGFPGREWPHFSLALLSAARGRVPAQPSIDDGPQTSPPAGRWQRHHEEVLLFNAPDTAFPTVSYVDVVRGDVPPEFFRDRYVIVGVTADTEADLFSSHNGARPGLLSGIDIFATMLQSLDQDRHIHAASAWQDLAFNLIPLVVVLFGLLWLGPLGMVSLILCMLTLRAGLQVAQPWTGIRFSAAAGLGGLLLVYPIWSLMRLNAAYRFLQRGTRELNTVLHGLPLPSHPNQEGDFLDREIDATATAVQRVRDLHRFVRDGVDHLPDANLVLNRRGRVFMANQAAAHHWRQDAWMLVGQDAHTLLVDIRSRSTGLLMIGPEVLSSTRPVAIQGEGEDSQGRILLLRCVPFFDADNAYAGWMVALVDITDMRRAQSQRDEALRFISHDIREPSAAVLTVVELSRADPALLPRELLLQRIEQHARTGLAPADGFVNLARAEAQPFKPEALDLLELAMQAVDNAWANARRKEVNVELETDLEEAPFIGDRDLLSRALANLMSNALKFSPTGGRVTCRVSHRAAQWTIAIRDEGPGIPTDLQPKLFQPFHRLHRESHPEVQGVGLGLLLVRTTMQRHGGTMEIDSAEGAGCTFILLLPKPPTEPEAPPANAQPNYAHD